jgi:copper ion binding protein
LKWQNSFALPFVYSPLLEVVMGTALQKSFAVRGMHCEKCAESVERALASLAGVMGVNVELDKKSVSVEYDASAVTLEMLQDAVAQVGFELVAR